ncbi:MAG: hypothetical protein F6K11_35845 [Leptolyngbya sp. SIO3F4]|nr:hypothetical protein [Leptolyngbya sp. SIO3F4]
MNKSLWDMAGIDGLVVAKHLFGEDVGYLAPFQSMETTLQGKDCSVLRLCERNFRISYSDSLQKLIEPIQANIWLKKFNWLTSLTLSTNFLSQLISQVTVRPPHRLENIPNHQAVPVQLQDIPFLLWQHPKQGQRLLELHLACKDRERLVNKLEITIADLEDVSLEG